MMEQSGGARMRINRLNDVFFKALMGDVRRKRITLHFLNAVVHGGEPVFIDLIFADKEMPPDDREGKLSLIDIRAITNDGTEIDIEVQIRSQRYFSERVLYYGAKMYVDELGEGDIYAKLRPVIVIVIAAETMLPYSAFHTYRHYVDENGGEVVDAKFNDISFHFIELSKLKLSDLKNLSKMEAWSAYFSGRYERKEMEEIMMTEPVIREAVRYESRFSGTKQLRMRYEQREKAIRDYNSGMHDAREQGREQGLEEGLEEGRAEGRAEGLVKGRAEGQAEMLKSLVQKGVISIAVAAEELGVTEDAFKQMAML